MATFQPLPFNARPDWQEVLQKPYLNQYAMSPQSIIADRQAAMSAASDTEISALSAALKAQRDKELADYILTHTPRGGGGGGGGGGRGGGGGGGDKPAVWASIPERPPSYMPSFPDSTPAPRYNPSSYIPPNDLYARPPGVTYAKPRDPNLVGVGPHKRIKPKPKVVSKSRVVLS